MEQQIQMQERRDTERIMQALRLAEKGKGTTSPNPPVGAVICKGKQILGVGYHREAGGLHAERLAIADACERGHAADLSGSTLYVTLEPCSSYGRTPPCTDAILEAGISRVVYGCTDPDPRHRGRANALLEAGGVQVVGGVAESACRAFLEPWMHSLATGCPWVVAKIAATLDGRLVRAGGRKRISCRESQVYVHRLRSQSDAILIGGNTLRQDDPQLTVRCVPCAPEKRQPRRIIFTQHGDSLPRGARVFTDLYRDRTLVYENVQELREVLMQLYHRYHVVQLMLECGGRLLRKFVEAGLVREWVHIAAPIVSGGEPLLLPGAAFLPHEITLHSVTYTPCGQDIIVRGIVSGS